MGKKSLFEPTIPPEKAEKEPIPGISENIDINMAANATGPDADPAATAVSPSEVAGLYAGADFKAFENDPLIGRKQLLFAVAVLGGLIIVILIASMNNAGNYYVKHNRGAVEIWQGDFSPLGKERLLILHGTSWDRPLAESYSREAVFSFAAVYFLEKARALAEAPVSDDFDRIEYYLDRVRELFSDPRSQEIAGRIKQVQKHIREARVLQASGEKEAVSLAQEKISSAGRMLTGLIADMAAGTEQAEKAASGH